MSLTLIFSRLGLAHSKVLVRFSVTPTSLTAPTATSLLHTTTTRRGLDEFFEPEKNRGEDAIRVGRSWRKDELRLRSNSDLHKLWYVLLKERNMLLTMEEAHKQELVPMPNPERIDKVEESMENLEEVVRKRNRAYYNLEVGWDGERDRVHRQDCLGRRVPYKPKEHAMPFLANSSYRKHLALRFLNPRNSVIEDFQARLGERKRLEDAHKRNLEMKEAARVVRRFPTVNLEALKEKYPLVDTERLMRWIRIKGNNDHPHNVHSDHPGLTHMRD